MNAVAEKERSRFEARLSINLAEGGRGQRRVKVSRSPRRSVANDTTSFPLNRFAAVTTTTVTDAKGSGNGSGLTVLLVCAVRSRRIYSSPLISASYRFEDPSCIHDYSNPSPLTLDACNIIDKSVPAPFVLVPNPLAEWKSALVLGKSGATVPANPDSHPPSPVLTGVKPVVDVRGGLVNSVVFESGTHYHRMPVESFCAAAVASREGFC